jgi:hypothetical protein
MKSMLPCLEASTTAGLAVNPPRSFRVYFRVWNDMWSRVGPSSIGIAQAPIILVLYSDSVPSDSRMSVHEHRAIVI